MYCSLVCFGRSIRKLPGVPNSTSNAKAKKSFQLGMNFATAAGRLRADLLFKFVALSGERCFRCNGELTRENFSIEHKKPWLDADNPKDRFFDLENIAFSHHKCNAASARRTMKKYFTLEERVQAKRRSDRRWRNKQHGPSS